MATASQSPTEKDPSLVVRSDVTPSDLAEPVEEKAQHPHSPWSWLRPRTKKRAVDLDAVATQRSVFDDPDLAPYYQPQPDYENLHRFDPGERWTHREEKAVRRKTDGKIFVWVLVMFFALNIDRGNLSSALADNLLDDINVSTDDYNNAQNMYRVGFLISEIPSQMIGKKLGPDRWLPVQIILWSLASGGQFFVRRSCGPWRRSDADSRSSLRCATGQASSPAAS